jgi:hypothetical protein
MSILIQYIDPNFRSYPLLYCPNMRNPVGKDAEYALKVIAKLSDKEMEKWARENYMDKKGFIRE